MAKFFLESLCFVVMVVTLGTVSAFLLDDVPEFHARIRPSVLKCISEFGISEDDLIAAKGTGKMDNLDPCLLACFDKEFGILDDQGKFAMETSMEKIKEFIKDENTLQKFEKLGDICTAVNNEDVSDDKKGCERSVLLHNCFMENKDSVGL